jgi:hypothetical protein
MSGYQFRRTALKPDGTRHVESVKLSGDELILRTGRDNELAFRTLLDQWNAVSLRAQPGSVICIYTAEVTSG